MYILVCAPPDAAAIGILCPNAQAISPIAVEILRNHFSFLVRSRLLNEAIAASALMVQVFLASQLENSAFKVLASVTVIQLSQGDAVKVRNQVLFCIIPLCAVVPVGINTVIKHLTLLLLYCF